MKRSLIRLPAIAIVSLLSVALASAGGGVWVSSDGTEHVFGADDHAVFFGHGEQTEFNLADLRDGESRTFGVGEREVTASRAGDEGRIERDAAGDAEAVDVTCRLATDTCKILTFDDDERIAIVISKQRECDNGVGDCDPADIEFLHDGDAHGVVVEVTVECDEQGNCEESETRDVFGDGEHGDSFDIEVIAEADGGPGKERVIVMGAPRFQMRTGGKESGNVFVHASGVATHSTEGSESFDVSELLDGETRIFGIGDKQVVARRDGDTVRLTREATDDRSAMDVDCRLPQDSCTILTFDDDPEKIALMIRKTDGEGLDGVRHIIKGHAGDVQTIEFIGGDDVVVGEDGHKSRRVKVVRDRD